MRNVFGTLRLLAVAIIGAAALAACGPDKDTMRFEGKLQNIRQAEFYIYSEENPAAGFDTIHISNGMFEYEKKIDRPSVLTLLYPNFSKTYIVAEPGATIKMKGDAAKIGEAEITGNEDNKRLTEFRQRMFSQPAANLRPAAAQFIRDNAATLSATAIFLQVFAELRQPDQRYTAELLQILKSAQPQAQILKDLERRLLPLSKAAEGQSMPSFSLTAASGTTITDNDCRRSPLLLVFWASWNYDSYSLLRQAASLQKRFAPKLQVVTLSFDTDKAAAARQIKDAAPDLPLVCDGKGFSSPHAETFAVNNIPGTMLIDAKGKIIARDLTGKQLDDRVQALF